MNEDVVREGRVWVFGDNINTDLIFPNVAFRLPEAEQPKMVFSANRPGWVDQVQDGDLVVGGVNFGMGSGRPIGKLLGALGIKGVVAETVNGLGLKNCISYGFPALACPGVSELFEEGHTARVNYSTGEVANVTTGKAIQARPLPGVLVAMIQAGGMLESLFREGLIEPTPPREVSALSVSLAKSS